MQTVRVFTLNVWSGFRYNGLIRLEEYESAQIREKRFNGLLHEIERLQPNLLALGELNPLFDREKQVKDATGYDSFVHMGVAGVRAGRFGFPLNLREGDGIFAAPALHAEWVGRAHLGGSGWCGNTFSFHFDNLTQALLIRFRTPGGRDCYFCGTHFTAAPDDGPENRHILERYAQEMGCGRRRMFRAGRKLSNGAAMRLTEADRLLDFLRRNVPADAPLIVAGDLNAETGWLEVQTLLAAGFTDLTPFSPEEKKTWDPRFNRNLSTFYAEDAQRNYTSPYKKLEATDEMTPRNIDHILVRNLPQQPADCCVIAADQLYEGLNLSDHFGLFAELEIE